MPVGEMIPQPDQDRSDQIRDPIQSEQGCIWTLTKYTIRQSADLGFGPTNLRTQKFLKDTPPVLHVFFSSSCRILLDLRIFSPVRARALLEKFSAPRARTVVA